VQFACETQDRVGSPALMSTCDKVGHMKLTRRRAVLDTHFTISLQKNLENNEQKICFSFTIGKTIKRIIFSFSNL
jgi:hypothetical protein